MGICKILCPSIPKCRQDLYDSRAIHTKKAQVLHLYSSIIPGPEIALTVDEQIQIPTPELLYRYTRKVCREGTMHPLTHYGTCLCNSPVASSPPCPWLLIQNFSGSELSSDKALMTPFMYVAPHGIFLARGFMSTRLYSWLYYAFSIDIPNRMQKY